ncbi:MAG: DNA circularization N-terminal domain-containing protein [Deltaproteobacteria bacterium]|nr:DNA circularization N-terminal domain-containing protein [Deltaproteobacteria bacterium]
MPLGLFHLLGQGEVVVRLVQADVPENRRETGGGSDFEDTGATAQKFTVEAFVVGPGYMDARDRLRAALLEPGPGKLVHPWMGELTVVVSGRVRQTESTSRGGYCQFTIPLAVPRVAGLPSAETDTRAALVKASAGARAASSGAFAAVFSTASQLAGYVTAAVDQVRSAAALLDSVRGRISAVTGFVNAAAQAVTGLAGSAAALIRTPAQLASSVQNVVASVVGGVVSVRSALSALTELGGFGGGGAVAVPETTPQAAQHASGQRAIVQMVRVAAVSETARIAAELHYETADEAAELKTALLEMIDELAAGSVSAAEYGALIDLRAAVAAHLDRTAIDLPRLVRFIPPATQPALSIAWRLHGDPLREAEIVRMNRIRHPGFVPGGEALEVRSD